jgi:hypothetical protein
VVLAARHFSSLTNDGRTWPKKWSGSVRTGFRDSVELLRDRPLGSATELRQAFEDVPVAVLGTI